MPSQKALSVPSPNQRSSRKSSAVANKRTDGAAKKVTQKAGAKQPEVKPVTTKKVTVKKVTAKKVTAKKVAAKKASAPVAARQAAHAVPAAAGGRRIQVRRSGVHGKGVFALQTLAKGELIIEYKGRIIDWDEALRRHPHDPSQPNHTFYFHLEGGDVIDGADHGNAARWINHACVPNCEADEDGRRIFIKALRTIKPGEELFFDYRLVLDERYTPAVKKEYACWCGHKQCRKTMLGPKR